jgi:hypothetical protein
MARYRRLTPEQVRAVRDALRRSEMDSAQAARMLYRRLKGLSAREVQAVLAEAVAEYAEQAGKDILAGMDAAARAGSRIAASGLMDTALRNLPPGLAEKAAEWVERQAARRSYTVSTLRGGLSQVTQGGRVFLSRRLHGINTEPIMRGLSKALAEGIRHGQTASTLAQQLRDKVGHSVLFTDDGPPGFRIADEVRAIAAEAKKAITASGDPRAWARSDARRMFARYERTLARGELGSRAAAEHFADEIAKAVARGSAEAVDRAVTWRVWNMEQRHQRLVSRTETDRAFDEAYKAASDGIPWVAGLMWNLAGDFNCPECSALAQGHSYGMPAGCYTKDEFPKRPHPGCDCFGTEVLDESKEPQTEAEWEATLAS